MKITTLKTPSSNKYNAAAERAENAVGSRIAAARKSRGLSIASFADALKEYGVSLTKRPSANGKRVKPSPACISSSPSVPRWTWMTASPPIETTLSPS